MNNVQDWWNNFSGNVQYTVAQKLYSDLLEARERLSVNTYLHLIYLVIPYENVQSVKINPNVFNVAVSFIYLFLSIYFSQFMF